MIAKLGLTPHPDGGHYRESWRATTPTATDGDRPTATAALYLLAAGERSARRRVDATEVWLFHGGDPLELSVADDADATPVTHVLGTELIDGEQPQVVVPTGAWQSARTLGTWSLVSRVVSAGVRFEGSGLAPGGRQPGRRRAS